MKSKIKVTTNVILISLIFVSTKFFFDDDYTNDHIGWLILLIFWAIRSLYGFVSNLQEGNKKLAIADFSLMIVAGYFVLTHGM